MKYFYYSSDEKADQRAKGLAPAFIVTDNGPREFTTSTDYPIHSGTGYRLVHLSAQF